MKKYVKTFLVLLAAIQIVGCAGLAKMKKADFVKTVEPGMAMVNIVRPRVFAGDGAQAEMWDADGFIGTLSAGSMIQYKTSPGIHTFMVYTQGSWGIAKGELKPGKSYYLKYNVGFGFITLGVAEAGDPRIDKWNSGLTPMTIDSSSSKSLPKKEITKARSMLKQVDNGTAKYDVISDRNAI